MILKSDLEVIYDHLAESIRIRSKYNWYSQQIFVET